MSEEVWRAIPGFEGSYSVSNLGRVRSETRTVVDRTCVRVFKGILRKPVRRHCGHYAIVLRKDNKNYGFLVHRLVLLAFTGPAPTGFEGCHLDGNPGNNRIDNLIWAPHAENEKHKIIHGTSNRGSNHYLSKLTERDVFKIKKLLRNGLSQQKIALQFGVDRRVINQIATGKTWKHVEILDGN